MDHLLVLRKMKFFLFHYYPRMKQIATFYSKMQLDQTISLQDFSVMFPCHMFVNMNVIILLVFLYSCILLFYYFKGRIIISNKNNFPLYFLAPSPQENLLFYVKDVGTTEVVFSWNDLSGWNNLNKWLKLGYKIIIKYYLDYTEEQHFESVPPNTTEKAITQLSPGRVYRFLFSAISEWEAKTTLSPVFIVETCKLQDI